MLVGRAAAEYAGLRNGTLCNGTGLGLALAPPAGKGTHIPLPQGTGAAIDLAVRFKLPDGTAHVAAGPIWFTVQVLAAQPGTTASPQYPGMGIAVTVSPPGPDGTRTASIGDVAGASMSGVGTGNGGADVHINSFPILATETTVDVRVLVDRSIAEFFVQGGRAAKTERGYPGQGEATVILGASFAGAVTESFEVHDMGCGWE